MSDKIILLVEDNPDDEELTFLAFKASKVSNAIVVARDGAQALDYLFGTGEYTGRDLTIMPTLILLDLNLPKIDGFEVLSRIRSDSRTRRLPVIIMTTSREHDEVIKAYDKGCNSFVNKPVEYSQFREAVNQLGLYWLIHNVPPPESA
jgi:CheY-like chemotaxis protein